MLEVWGQRTIIRFGDGRLVTVPVQADDDTALDVPIAELRRALLVTTSDERLAVLLFFRSPQYPVNGAATLHHPVPVFLEPEQQDAAIVLVRAIERELLDARRFSPPRPDFTPPPLEPSPYGPMRRDVTWAAQRMQSTVHTVGAITALQTLAAPAETVLELAQATYTGVPGLLAITTQRLLFVSAGAVHELPVAALDGAEVTIAAVPGAPATLTVRAHTTTVEFVDWTPADFTRLAQALRLACEVEHLDGSLTADRPSPVDLYAQWQLLAERARLGMVGDEAFHREATGIMLAAGN